MMWSVRGENEGSLRFVRRVKVVCVRCVVTSILKKQCMYSHHVKGVEGGSTPQRHSCLFSSKYTSENSLAERWGVEGFIGRSLWIAFT